MHEPSLTIAPGNDGWRLSARQWLPRPIDEVFAFFSDAHNLETLTPSWLRFQVLTPQPIHMRAGTIIDYRLRVRGVPLRWQSEITRWNPPHAFVDEMRRGPYRRWHHTHTFTALHGGTLVEDHVDYAVPGGVIVHRLLVGPDVARIFTFRRERLAALFAAAGRPNYTTAAPGR